MEREEMRRVAQRFFIFCVHPQCSDDHGARDLFRDFDPQLAQLGDPIRPIAQAFRRNLAAVVHTTTIPLQMASASVDSRRLERLCTQRRLLAAAEAEEFTPELIQAAHEAAVRDAYEQKVAPDLRDEIAMETMRELHALLARPGLEEAAIELLRQGLVLSWSALEVLSRDLFLALLNTAPRLVSTLMADETSRRLFQTKAIPIETLITHAFDVSGRMGDLLAEQHAVDTVPSMRSVYGCLMCDDRRVSERLGAKALWLIFQRRHLIVHRRATIDSAYLAATGESLEEGTELRIGPLQLERDLFTLRDVGLALLTAGGALLSRVQGEGA